MIVFSKLIRYRRVAAVLLPAFLVAATAYLAAQFILDGKPPFLLFGIIAILIVSISLEYEKILVYLLLALAFFGNTLEDFNIIPPQFNWLTEIAIIGLLLKSSILSIKEGRNFRCPLLPYVVAFALTGMCGMLLNGSSPLLYFLSLRLLVRFYFLFVALVNMNYSEDELRHFYKVIFLLFMLQIPVAFTKIPFYGIGESTIGTYGTHGGGNSVAIPVVAISFCAGLYAYYKRDYKYILLILAFAAFGIIGGKRALPFFFTMQIFLILLFIKLRIEKKIFFAVAAASLILLVGVTSMSVIPTLNPEREIGGSINVRHVRDFAMRYETAEATEPGSKGYTGSIGRISTLKMVFSNLRDRENLYLLLGLGPGSATKSRFLKDERILHSLGIGYGITGLSHLVLEYGLLGFILYTLMLFKIFVSLHRKSLEQINGYWRGIYFGAKLAVLGLIIIHSTYSALFTDDLLPMIFYFFAGSLYSKQTGPG